MELKDLVGEHDFPFVPNIEVRHPTDADANGVMFGLGNRTFLIFEDPSDGYRSSAGAILSVEGSPASIGAGYPQTLYNQRVVASHETKGEYGDEDDILSIRSIATGREIMRVGTRSVDDYYPSFVCEWFPDNLDVNVR